MYVFLSFMSITYIKYLYGRSSINAFSINMLIAMAQFILVTKLLLGRIPVVDQTKPNTKGAITYI